MNTIGYLWKIVTSILNIFGVRTADGDAKWRMPSGCMDKNNLERMIATNQAALDQMWTSAEGNLVTLDQMIGIATPGLVTHFLQLVSFQTKQNINKRNLESMS